MAWAATADPKKPAEAVKFFQSKRPVGSAELGKLSAKAKQKAFTVASVAHADVLQSVFDGIEKAIAEGTSFDDFVAEVGDKLESEWGKPDSGRLETIFRTNVQSAYSAGRHARLTDPDVAQAYEYWMYDAVLDSRTSEICRSLDGTIVRADSDWWEGRHAPCHFNAITRDTMILTESGEVAASSIVPGTLVLTHTGQWRRVTAVLHKVVQDRIVRHLHLSSGRTLRVTNEHPVLVQSANVVAWRHTGNVQVGDVLFQYPHEGPGVDGIAVCDPNNAPALPNEPSVAFNVVGSLVGPTVPPAISFDGNLLAAEGEVNNVSTNSNLGRSPAIEDAEQVLFSWGEFLGQVDVCQTLSCTLTDSRHVHRVSFAHPGSAVGALLPESPVTLTAPLGYSGRIPVADTDLVKSTTDTDSVTLAPSGKERLSKTKIALDGPDAVAHTPVPVLDDGANSASVSKVDWHAAIVVSITESRYSGELIDLSVDGDETYVAEGVIVHNCRSVITPLTREDAEARGITKTPPTTLAADGFGARPAIDHAVEAERWKPEVVNYDPAIQDALDKLLPTGTTLTALADWNEEKHPRAKGGKFAPKGGADYKAEGDKHRAKSIKRQGDVEVGKHIGELKGDKADEHGAAALKHLHAMGLGPLLKKTKLKELHITSDIPPAKGATGRPRVGSSGRYSAQSGRLMVKVPRDPKSYGQDFVAGQTHSISKAAKTEQEAVQRTLSHEIGHHYYHSTPGVDKLAARAQKKGNPITKYAGSGSPGEYFAECFAAYHHEPEALLKHDPVGWNMVQRALHKHGLVEKPAITRRKPAPMPEPPAKPEPKPAKEKKPKPAAKPAPTKQKAPPKEPEHVTIARGKERVAKAEHAELHEVEQRIGPPGGPPKVNTDPSKVERDGTGTCLRGDPQVMAAYSFTNQHDTIIRQIDQGMSDQEIVKSLADHLQKYRETWPQYVERLTADHPGQYDPAQGGKALEKPTDFIDACRAHHKALTELLAGGGPTDGPVHRGMKNMSEDEFHKFLGQETIGLGAMSSTSRSIGMADTYSQSKGDGYGIILTMHGVKHGVGVDDTTAFEGEREVIVGKKERFKVKRVTLLGDRRAHVEVEAT